MTGVVLGWNLDKVPSRWRQTRMLERGSSDSHFVLALAKKSRRCRSP
jgi:hypothetical protein